MEKIAKPRILQSDPIPTATLAKSVIGERIITPTIINRHIGKKITKLVCNLFDKNSLNLS